MHLRAVCLALFLAVGPAWAQDADVATDDVEDTAVQPSADAVDTTFPDQAEWNAFADRVIGAVEAEAVSDAILSELRSDLVTWRDTFLDRQSLNAARISTVTAQIAALGAIPESGEEEPRIAARRDVLNAQLRALTAPSTIAAEAYTEANGLIGEIDSLIRSRQTEQFLKRSQSPLNPAGWSDALSALSAAYVAMKSEVTVALNNPSRRATFLSALPVILGLLAVAIVFTLRGRAWFVWGANMIVARSRSAHGVVQFILSLGQVVIPLIGVVALANALQLSGMTGRRLGALIEVLPRYSLTAILAHWLSGQLLPRNMTEEAHPFGMSPQLSDRAHNRFIFLGYMMMVFGLANEFVQIHSFSSVPAAAIMFPIGVILAFALYWFAHIIRKSTIVNEDVDEPRQFRIGLRAAISRGLMLAAVVGVVLAALGYANAFEMVTFPAARTILVLALLLLLQRLATDAYAFVSKSEDGAREALVPVLIGFALVLLALPVLAIIWGAQVTDITELWARFREGFTIGETRISPSNFLLFAVVFGAGYAVTRLTQGALRSTVLPRTKMDAGGQTAVVSGMGYIGIFLAAVIAITTAGIDLSGLAIVAGALSVGIGFGLQNIVSNFISGIILLIERPISQGDWIEVGGQMGYVRDISVRSTRIETFDRTDVIVPNADLISGTVTNYTRGNSVGRAIVPVGVAYGTDTAMVTSILKEIAEAQPLILMNPPPNVLFIGFGADSLDFEIRAMLRDVNYVMVVKSEMNHAIAKRFAAEGIEIPFGQRDIWLRNPEALDFNATRRAALKSKPETPEEDTPE